MLQELSTLQLTMCTALPNKKYICLFHLPSFLLQLILKPNQTVFKDMGNSLAYLTAAYRFQV